MAKAIMVQGTMSNAGKSLLVAGLCRIFAQDGHRVAPFKSQNMALNSFVTDEGLEMGRAQVMQAEAAGIRPRVCMNPILLKPTGDKGSQVIVNGEVMSNMSVQEYYRYKEQLPDIVRQAYQSLADNFDIVVLEGAGSPAEINLKEGDLVNMGMAKMAGAPVLLAGDIDLGGVFAQIYGTVCLLEADERAMIRGLIINKFRGDPTLLGSGLEQLQRLCGTDVVGVVPYMKLDLDDEDSLAPRLTDRRGTGPLDVAVIRLPYISNFTDFNALGCHHALGLRYVDRAEKLGRPDLVILPGSKNTMWDLNWLRGTGLADCVVKLAVSGTPIIGICGGYQMLGTTLRDPGGVEQGGEMQGLGLLPMETVFDDAKTRTRAGGTVSVKSGFFAPLDGVRLEGYEIHMGRTVGECLPSCVLELPEGRKPDGGVCGNVFGTYLHGFFDTPELVEGLAALLMAARGLEYIPGTGGLEVSAYKEQQYDLLAQGLRDSLDMDKIYTILEAGI